jgi:threonine synthase
MTPTWSLECSHCDNVRDASGLPDVCPECGLPWLVRYSELPAPDVKKDMGARPWTMWRYRELMPLGPLEQPVSLGEGMTPLVRVRSVEKRFNLKRVFVKDEGQNPCGSFKSRGLSAAVTRASLAGAEAFTIPTAGNAGVSLAAYGRAARIPVRVFAPRATPSTILEQIRLYGAELELLDGHIGDCGKAARAYASESGAVDMSTLREPYRIEGKKTLGLELAEQMQWTLPDCIVYPTGGGTGLIGMWKAFDELSRAGWISTHQPRMVSVQSSGCAPVVKAFDEGADAPEPWPDPVTIAAGLRVPGPLGGRLILEAIRESGGRAVAVDDAALDAARRQLAEDEGIDACPEGGATVAAIEPLVESGTISEDDTVVLFNTGAGWLYR